MTPSETLLLDQVAPPWGGWPDGSRAFVKPRPAVLHEAIAATVLANEARHFLAPQRARRFGWVTLRTYDTIILRPTVSASLSEWPVDSMEARLLTTARVLARDGVPYVERVLGALVLRDASPERMLCELMFRSLAARGLVKVVTHDVAEDSGARRLVRQHRLSETGEVALDHARKQGIRRLLDDAAGRNAGTVPLLFRAVAEVCALATRHPFPAWSGVAVDE